MTIATNAEIYELYEEDLARLCAMRESIVEHPEKDFTRQTALTIPRLMSTVVSFGAENLKPAAADFFRQCRDWPDGKDAPYVSAITMARQKRKAIAFEILCWNVSSDISRTFEWESDAELGYHLLPRAVDGTTFPYTVLPNIQTKATRQKAQKAGGGNAQRFAI